MEKIYIASFFFIKQKFVSETPLSGPGAFPKTSEKTKQGKKRKMDHDDDENEDSLENNYRGNSK